MPLERRPHAVVASLLATLTLACVFAAAPPARAAEKPRVVPMSDYFRVETPLSYTPGRGNTPAVVETTVRHEVYFSDMEGSNAGWNVINFRQGQPNAWHTVTGGAHACVGTSWWMGQTGFLYGDGYDNNWVQILTTNPATAPINLAGTNNNTLTFKTKFQAEYGFDWGWVLIRGSNPSAKWDTLASYSGNFGSSCVNQSLDIPDSFTTVTQPVQLQFLFGSDLSYSTSDSSGVFTGWSLDDVEVRSQGNPPGGPSRFFDDMESGTTKWLTSTPNPGSLWHLETAPSTSVPATCFFLNGQCWVPFAGFGVVPNHGDAMLTSPTMDLTGVFSAATPTTSLKLQFDDWENIPFDNFLYWSLWIRGSNDQTTWTPWSNATGFVFSGGNPQCFVGKSLNFNPYMTTQTGIQPGTKYIQLGFRLRDEKATNIDGGPLKLDYNTEGIYFDNIGVYYVYTISGVEAVGGVPVGTRAAIRRVYPNPFNPSTTVEFSVPKQGPVAVRVFDLQGRQVATLAETSLPAGVYRVKWDGRDRNGRDVSSGVYFATIESGGGRQAARLILLK